MTENIGRPFTVEEASDTPQGALRAAISIEIALRCGQVPDVHPRLHEAVNAAARRLVADGWQRSGPTHGKAWEDRLNIICLCGKVCSGVIRKNPAGGFIGHPGSDTYVDPPAAQAFANHLWEMNHPPVTPSGESVSR